jgi:5-methylcytosine-specific restriction endonuclease McrA
MENNFYTSTRWRHLREVILRRDGYQCQLSKRYGKFVPAENVHHIFPREEFPEYTWESWNLISLSHDQHMAMHVATTGELSDEGIALLRKTARKYKINVPLRYQ